MTRWMPRSLAVLVLLACAGCGARTQGPQDEHAGHEATSPPARAVQEPTLPADAASALARLNASPRHGEWAMIRSGADSIRAWVVYPERADKAPVVLVVHEIMGLSHWVRAVADQFAKEGFIAIAPDLITMQNIANDSLGQPNAQAAGAAIRGLVRADVHRHLKAVAAYGMALPAAKPSYGIVGYCSRGLLRDVACVRRAERDPRAGARAVRRQ